MAAKKSHLFGVRLNSHVFGTGAFADVTEVVIETTSYEAETDYAARSGQGPAYVGSRYGEQTLTVLFKCATRASKIALIRAIDWPNRRDPHELVAWVGGDGADIDTLVQGVRSVVATNVDPGAHGVRVTFTTPDLTWRALEWVDSRLLTLTEYGGAVEILNPGHTTVQPEIDLGWTVQRDAGVHSETEGWRWFRIVGPITNLTDLYWEREAWCVDLGDTSAWVAASEAQALGHDVRVWHEGRDLPRTLTNWNTGRTFLWFHTTTPPGGAMTAAIVFGNPSATAPDTVSTKTGNDVDTYVAYDLQGYNAIVASATPTVITVAGTPWETSRWLAGYVQIMTGTGAGQRRQILSSGPNTITVTRPFTTTPDATSTFNLWQSGVAVDGGQASSGTTTTLTDSSANFGTDGQWVGARLTITAGSQAGQSVTVTDHTNNQLIFAAMPGAISSTSVYHLERYGAHGYMVFDEVYETVHRGGWRINRHHSQPGNVWFGDDVPGGWQPERYLENDDDTSNPSFIDVGSGGGHTDNYFTGLDARRTVGQARALPEEGQADGVSLYDPRGFQAMRFNYKIQNENAVGKFVLAGKPRGARDWEDLVVDDAAYAGPGYTPVGSQWVALNDTGEPYVRLYMGGLPNDGVEIPTTTSEGDDFLVRWYSILKVHLAHEGIGGLSAGIISAGAKVAAYHMNPAIRAGGGHEPRPPYDVATLNRVMLAAGQTLRLNLDADVDAPLCAIYAGEDVVAETPWAVTFSHVERELWQTSADDVTTVARDLLPVVAYEEPFGPNLLANGDIDTNAANWTLDSVTAGLTVTAGRVTSPTYDGSAGAYEFNVTANVAAGAGTISYYSEYVAVDPSTRYVVAGYIRPEQTTWGAHYRVHWYDSSKVAISNSVSGNQTTPINTWAEQEQEETSPANAAYARVRLIASAIPSLATGKVQFDDISMRRSYRRILNPSFGGNTTGWTAVPITGGVTVAWASVGSATIAPYDHHSSLRGLVSVAPASSWETAYESALFPVQPGEALDIPVALRVNTTAITIVLSLNGYDAVGAATGDGQSKAFTLPAANVWFPVAFGGPMGNPTGDTTQATLMIKLLGGSGVTGTAYVDAIRDGHTVLHVEEAEPGTTTVQVRTLPRYVD